MKNIKKNKSKGSLRLTREHPEYNFFAEMMSARVRLAIELAEARIAKSLSQQQLAKKARTTQKVISKIESANMNVGLDLLRRITDALELTFQIGRTFLGTNIQMTFYYESVMQNRLAPNAKIKVDWEPSVSSLSSSLLLVK